MVALPGYMSGSAAGTNAHTRDQVPLRLVDVIEYVCVGRGFRVRVTPTIINGADGMLALGFWLGWRLRAVCKKDCIFCTSTTVGSVCWGPLQIASLSSWSLACAHLTCSVDDVSNGGGMSLQAFSVGRVIAWAFGIGGMADRPPRSASARPRLVSRRR